MFAFLQKRGIAIRLTKLICRGSYQQVTVIPNALESHLRRAIAEYVEHYHQERTHQGLGNRLIEGVPEPRLGRVARRERLGGILNHYYREVA